MEIDRVLDENPTGARAVRPRPAAVLGSSFKTAGDPRPHRLNVGSKTPTGSDVYARVEGQNRLFLTPPTTTTALNKSTFDLRDKRVLVFSRDAVDTLTLDGKGAPAIALAKKGADWRLTSPVDARADFSPVDGLIGRLDQVHMQSIVSEGSDAHARRAEELRPRRAAAGRDGRRRLVQGDAGHRRQEGRRRPLRPRPFPPDRLHRRVGAADRPDEEAGRPAREGRVRVPAVLGQRRSTSRTARPRRPTPRRSRRMPPPTRRPRTSGRRPSPTAKDVNQTALTDSDEHADRSCASTTSSTARPPAATTWSSWRSTGEGSAADRRARDAAEGRRTPSTPFARTNRVRASCRPPTSTRLCRN